MNLQDQTTNRIYVKDILYTKYPEIVTTKMRYEKERKLREVENIHC